ncbi:hypothetical protein, partial [Microbacterium lacticum]|uniref:hypothetical protein n=1 Tax=Microbacterium lacticum TaxID=33885 RepID=UPI001E627C48
SEPHPSADSTTCLDITASPGGTQGYAEVAVLIAVLGFLARTLGLGIVALVLSARVRSEGVDVYRPT